MATQNYSTVLSRNLIRAEFEMLKHAEPIMVLSKFGAQKEQPMNKTDTIVFRRQQPFNATASEVPDITPTDFITSEGVTPTSNTITFTDVSVTLQQYAVLFRFSSKTAYMYEDDIPEEMTIQTGETMAEIYEKICYGQVKAGTSVVYSNGSTRVGVNTPVSLGKFRLSARSLESNRAKRITKMIRPGDGFGTSAVEPGWLVFHHTDVTADIRDLPGFIHRVDYGVHTKPVHPREIGSVEEFRFIPSPLFVPHLAAGAAVGSSGMLAADTTNIDVYPVIICAQDSWGQVSLKGHGYSGVSPTLIPANEKNHANPMGMFGFVGADFWCAAVILNQNWMTRLETAVTDLDT